jgi:hypothetical protein
MLKFIVRRVLWTIPVILLVIFDDVRDDEGDQGESVQDDR